MTTHLLAQLKNPVLPPAIGGGNPNSGGQVLGNIIGNLVGALFIAGFLLTFMQLLVGGLHWITSGGDKAGLEKARDQITNAIIGIIIVGATYALTTLIGRFFGLDLKSLTVPSIGK